MSTWEWALILSMAAVTFAVRYPVLAMVSRITLPTWSLALLRYIPPAVLAAIIAPAMLMPDGQTVSLSLGNAYLVAGVVAAVVAATTRNLLATIVVGMGTFWLWSWLI